VPDRARHAEIVVAGQVIEPALSRNRIGDIRARHIGLRCNLERRLAGRHGDALSGDVVAVTRPLQLRRPAIALPLCRHRCALVTMRAARLRVLHLACKGRCAQQQLAACPGARLLYPCMQPLPLAVWQRVGLRHIERIAVIARAGAEFVAGEPADMPGGVATGMHHHQPGVVVILDAQVVAGAEPETLRSGRQQPERHLLDTGLELGLVAELPARIGVMHGVEAVIPAVLRGKRERPCPCIQVCLQQFQLQAAGGRVVQPAVVESHGAAGLEVRCCILAAL